MKDSGFRLVVGCLAFGLFTAPGPVVAQEGHEGQEHAEHVSHEKNEVAVFAGATRRLKFEEDETGATWGIEYMRQIRPRVGASLAVEFASGTIERDWVAMFKLGVQPFDNWAHPLVFYVGTGIEVARVDEELLEQDEQGGAEPGDHEGESPAAADEHGESGERETEVDALMRLGTGWIFHAGSFSIIPNVNFDLVGEDWAIVGGVTFGYRF